MGMAKSLSAAVVTSSALFATLPAAPVTTSANPHVAASPSFTPESLGAKCDGVTDDTAPLAQAAAAANQAHASLVIDCRLLIASGEVMIKSPVRFEHGGQLEVRRGASVEFRDLFAAPPTRVFYLSGGRVSFKGNVPQFLVTWWGGDPQSVADYAPALSAAAAAAMSSTEGHVPLELPEGTVNIGSTVTIKNGIDLRIRGAGNRKTYLKWTGRLGGTMLRLVNCYRTTLEHFSLDGTNPAASELVLVQNDTTQPDYSLPSSLNVFRDLRFVGGAYAIRFSIPPGAQDVMNDQSRIERIVAANQSIATVSIRGQNSKQHGFYECSFTASPRAVLVEDATQGGGGAGGSFHWYGGYVSSSVANFEIQGVSVDGLSIFATNSESSARFLVVRASSQDFPVNIIGCRYSAANLNPDGFALVLGALGPYNIIGNHWGEQAQSHVPRFRLGDGGPTAADIHSNSFASLDSVATDVLKLEGAGPFQISMHGNLYRKSDGTRVLKDEQRASYKDAISAGTTDLHGSVTVKGRETEATTTFPSPQHQATKDYFVTITPTATTGLPPAAAHRVLVVTKNTSGFVVKTEAAPGEGSSVTFDWRLFH